VSETAPETASDAGGDGAAASVPGGAAGTEPETAASTERAVAAGASNASASANANANANGADTDASADVESINLRDPHLYFNRELSWLDFNDRVLQLGEDEHLPLIERLKFIAIFSSNLDEFFMVRVAGVHEQIESRIPAHTPDGLSPTDLMEALAAKTRKLVDRHARHFTQVLQLALAHEGIVIASPEAAGISQEEIAAHFREHVFPTLTPLAIGLGRPFPYISNLSLSLLVHLRDPASGTENFARVKVPKEVVPRFVELRKNVFIPLEEIIAANLDTLFPGMEVVSYGLFRVTRDADFTISDEADDLLAAVEHELRQRRFGEVVRLEVGAGIEPSVRARLTDWLDLEENQVYEIDGPLDLTDLWQIANTDGHDELRQSPWTPVTHPKLRPRSDDTGDEVDIFARMREGDFLVHYPYHSFASSAERLVIQASEDPHVLAIKMTVYRTSAESALVPALITAAENGKQAVCMVELKARFDERRNIRWSRALEEVGAHVVYGIPGLKTHAKVILVVRQEHDQVRNYVMIGTGNFHAMNARLYEDFGLFTTDPEIGEDVADMFNSLTGYAHPQQLHKVLVAPNHMRGPLTELIERTIAARRAGQPARIVLKMNALVDRKSIEELYRASQAGVPIDLNVRGICCLVPGVPGVSETIHVVSVLGRFLEHSRIFSFTIGDEQITYIGSADIMPRNLNARVELAAPIEQPELRAELADTLERCFADDSGAWTLSADGTWHRREGRTRFLHEELMARTLAQLPASAEYD
jgi:polyphosphate kinase